MTTYRLFPSTSGPATAVGFSGSFLSGVVFTVTQGNTWFQGYWWWVAPTGQSTSGVKCALWTAATAAAGTVVPGTVVTSGTLTAGQWNFIPIASPVQLAQGLDPVTSSSGSAYIAAIGVNGNFPDTTGFWGTGGPGVNGISNGPLFAYSGVSGNGGTAQPPWSLPQGVFTTTASDPSLTMPTGASTVDNFWVDVQVSDTAPGGYGGSYRLWPNKADGNPAISGDAAVAYNIATQINVSQTVTLNAIHYLVPANVPIAAGLATSADVWDINTHVKIAGISSPAWTMEDGTATPALGTNPVFWAKAPFAGGTTLAPGTYRVSVYNGNGINGSWSARDATTGYFTTGAAASGITWGPLSAPDQAAAALADFYPGTGTGTTGGQPVFAFDGLDSYPHVTTGTNPPQVYFVDLEATPAAGTGAPPTAILTVAASAPVAAVTANPAAATVVAAAVAPGVVTFSNITAPAAVAVVRAIAPDAPQAVSEGTLTAATAPAAVLTADTWPPG